MDAQDEILTVDDFVAAEASDFNKSLRLLTSSLQQVQYQSLKNLKFQQRSIMIGIWFGTRCSTRRSSRKPFRFNIRKFQGVEGC